MRASWIPLVIAGVLFTSAPAFADDAGEEAYDQATELHEAHRFNEAAHGFAAAYGAGYRQDASAYNAACALARAGQIDAAFQWLQRAYEDGFELESYLDDDRDLRSLRADPRFAALQQAVLGGRTSRKAREGERLAQKLAGMRDAKPEKLDEVGRELLDAGRYDDAGRAFESAASRDDAPATSLYNAACARSLGGQKAAALDLLQRAVEQGFADPKHIDEDDDLDNVRNERRFAQIRALAVELEVPDYPSQWNDRDAKTRRQWEAALPRVEGAVRKYPHLGQVWFNLGFAQFALGRPEQAVAPFEKAVSLDYRKATSMYNAACAHAMAGHADAAFTWLDRAIGAGFDSWSLIRDDADLDNLRTDPRFRRYLETARAQQGRHWH